MMKYGLEQDTVPFYMSLVFYSVSLRKARLPQSPPATA